MTHRVGRKGQVVIPKVLRDAMNLETGDEVTFSLDAYYYDNPEEIDAELAADKSWAESLDQ